MIPGNVRIDEAYPEPNADADADADVDANENADADTDETTMKKRKTNRHECGGENSWGVEHPCYGLDTKRAKWTNDELFIIKQKVEDIMNNNGGVEPANLNVLVLEEILEDPSAKPHFLYKHIENNLAIRHGIRKVKIR